MFARVLFPTDFSAYANTVFACLPDLKAAGLKVIVLVSVIKEADAPMPETLNRDDLNRIAWSIQEQLNVARMALEGHGLRVFTHVRYGSPAEQILRVAQEEQVDLIVIGAQGKTLGQELLLGSVAYEVARLATVPVLIEKALVVRNMGHVQCKLVCKGLFSHVLYPTDFSDYADAAFQLIKRLKGAGTQKVTALHVQDERIMHRRSAEQVAVFDEEDTARLEALCKTLRMFGLQARPLLRHGHPVQETLRVADEEGASLIVLGSRGRSAIQEILAGSTFENVLRLSRHPVLVVHKTASEGHQH